MIKKLSAICCTLLCVWAFSFRAGAQFRKDAFTQSYNDDAASSKDSVDVLFSFKEYFGGLAHKNELKPGTSFAGSLVFIGGQQIYNRQYWKLPIVYSTILGAAGAGVYLNTQGKHDAAKWCFIGAGLAYWGTLMDGIASYKAPWPKAGKATIYSLLLPGLGQVYNHDYWKIPVYLGGMACATYFLTTNTVNYERYRRIYIDASDTATYTGPISAESALYYRDFYRRYRDYSALALGLVYLLQVIDANVFSYMHNFEVSEDIAFSVSPAVMPPAGQYALAGEGAGLGLRLGLRF
ncbi:MAG: hypothetical protein J5871_06120 [Bacteroidales bacterium]|nr:hypothetical protein [Bacteroidales bacterium]